MELSYQHLNLGLLQEAASSTTLFNIYINDLPERLKKTEGIRVSMFTDIMILHDKQVTRTKIKKSNLKRTINSAINKLNMCALKNNMIKSES